MDASVVSKIKGKRILYCVLNWGLGHASRSIPLINALNPNNEIILASDGEAGLLLQKELEDLDYRELPSYGIHYKYSSMHLNMLLQFPKIIAAYTQEKKEVKALCEREGVDLIVSDHRYGCLSKGVHSIFLGHQLRILGSVTATKVNTSLISRFDECWVPDYKDQRLSGRLSDASGIAETYYIGPLSRMKRKNQPKRYDIAIVLSGPEPKRTNLESKILNDLGSSDYKICLIRGTKKRSAIRSKSIEVFDLIDSTQLNDIIASAEMIVCRSGHSSIMDLEVLNIPALIIPTSGQREQEYLAEHYSRKRNIITQTIEQLNIDAAREQLGL